MINIEIGQNKTPFVNKEQVKGVFLAVSFVYTSYYLVRKDFGYR